MLQLGIRGLGIARFKFNPISWFLKGEPGAWYDPSDFQPNWRRNLLTYSEDFSNAVWSKVAVSIGSLVTSPDGTLTATPITADGTTGTKGLSYSLSSGYIRTASWYVKAGTNNYVQIYFGGDGNPWINFDLSTGVLGSSGTNITPTITSLGSGWYRISAYTNSLTATNAAIAIISSATSGRGESNSLTTSVQVWHPQLEQSSSASTYQKITDGIQDYYTVQPQPVLFQDSAGTTPVTAVEQPVGLMLDKSRGLALGAELVTNGGPFTNTTGWVSRAQCTLAVVGNELIGTGTVSGSVYRFYYQPVTVIGHTYKVTVNITSLAGTGDMLTVYSSAGAGQIASISIPTTGIYTIYFTATTTTTCFEFGDINSTSPKYTGISNISVKQIAGNHAFQGDSTSTPAKRPMLSARKNWLLATEVLSTQSVSVLAGQCVLSFTGTGTITLSGTSTAGPLVGTGASERVSLTFTPTAGTLTLTVGGSVTKAQLEYAV